MMNKKIFFFIIFSFFYLNLKIAGNQNFNESLKILFPNKFSSNNFFQNSYQKFSPSISNNLKDLSKLNNQKKSISQGIFNITKKVYTMLKDPFNWGVAAMSGGCFYYDSGKIINNYEADNKNGIEKSLIRLELNKKIVGNNKIKVNDNSKAIVNFISGQVISEPELNKNINTFYDNFKKILNNNNQEQKKKQNLENKNINEDEKEKKINTDIEKSILKKALLKQLGIFTVSFFGKKLYEEKSVFDSILSTLFSMGIGIGGAYYFKKDKINDIVKIEIDKKHFIKKAIDMLVNIESLIDKIRNDEELLKEINILISNKTIDLNDNNYKEDYKNLLNILKNNKLLEEINIKTENNIQQNQNNNNQIDNKEYDILKYFKRLKAILLNELAILENELFQYNNGSFKDIKREYKIWLENLVKQKLSDIDLKLRSGIELNEEERQNIINEEKIANITSSNKELIKEIEKRIENLEKAKKEIEKQNLNDNEKKNQDKNLKINNQNLEINIQQNNLFINNNQNQQRASTGSIIKNIENLNNQYNYLNDKDQKSNFSSRSKNSQLANQLLEEVLNDKKK